MIADETAPHQRGAAYGLRQTLDTAGAFLAPLVAVGLMLWLAGNVRAVFWIAAVPALLSFLVAAALLHETGHGVPLKAKTSWHGFGGLGRPVRTLLVVGFLFGLARFSESFLILRAMAGGLSAQWSPLALALFNLAFLVFAYPAGALTDRVAPAKVLAAGIALLIVADLWLADASGLVAIGIGIALWGGHMALTQGVLSRMIADAAEPDKRASSFGAFYFVSGVSALIASGAAGLIWDRAGPAATFVAGAIAAAAAGLSLLLVPRRD